MEESPSALLGIGPEATVRPTPDSLTAWPMQVKPKSIPKGNIYNIVYGQKHKRGNQKIFVVRGIATDLENIMVFRRQKSEWKLMKFNS